jgi:hypothetical protein
MIACAKLQPCPEAVIVKPSAAYFVPVLKPMPPPQGEKEFYDYVLKLSESWDNLYIDRMKARKELMVDE